MGRGDHLSLAATPLRGLAASANSPTVRAGAWPLVIDRFPGLLGNAR